MSFLVKAFDFRGVFVCLVATLVICIFRILPQLGQLFMDDETSVIQCLCLELLHTSEILVVV